MPEPTSETLAVWLQDVVATVPDAETLKAFQSAVALAAKSSPSEMLDLVALAHGAGTKDMIQWLADLARSKAAPVPDAGNGALVRRLSAAAVVRLLSSAGEGAVIAGLATQSAAFLGLNPVLPELTKFAEAAIFKAGDDARRRALAYESTEAKVAGWVNEAIAPLPEGTAPSGRPDWERTATAIGKQMDDLVAEIRMRLELLDEEYDLLWWSHAGRSLTADADWTDITPPARRVSLVGHELAERTRIPATPMVDGLAAAALGDVSGKQLSLADVVTAARGEKLALATKEHLLLPISTALTQAKLYEEDDTWKTVVKKVHGIDVGRKESAVAIARQVIREEHLGDLL